MSQITIQLGGVATEIEAGLDGFKLFADKSIVALRVDGELRDLAYRPLAGESVEGVAITEPDGLAILRHSTAHVLAQAVQTLHPSAKLGIGPAIKDGFYYDFDVENPFTPEDLRAIEKQMDRIVRSSQRFMRRVTNEADAAIELA
ncbi:MAG: threonine--tRNA ligase, partial [Actinomycetota bacterium]